MSVVEDNDEFGGMEFEMVPYCECGKVEALFCHAEVCDAQWIPVIYIEPDWPNKTNEE